MAAIQYKHFKNTNGLQNKNEASAQKLMLRKIKALFQTPLL